MNEHFIILETFQHPVRCCCPGQGHEYTVDFKQGDIWCLTKERKYIGCLGWYFLIAFNNEYQFYIHVEDIENLYRKGSICSILDLELKINYLNSKVNEALDEQDRKAFLSYTGELNDVQSIKEKMKYTPVYN
jgi:hypothetical protein